MSLHLGVGNIPPGMRKHIQQHLGDKSYHNLLFQDLVGITNLLKLNITILIEISSFYLTYSTHVIFNMHYCYNIFRQYLPEYLAVAAPTVSKFRLSLALTICEL